MPKVRNMYIGGKQIKQPYLGSTKLKAVYLGSTMVWGNRNAKVWVLDRTPLSTTKIRSSGINGNSTTTYTHTSISTFTSNNANTYGYEELTANKTPGIITLWPATRNSYGFLNCYVCKFDGSDLSFPPSSPLAKIQLDNQLIVNPTSEYGASLGTSNYVSLPNSTSLEYLGENDYVFDIEAPDVRFQINKVILYNNYNFTNPPKLTALKLPLLSSNLTVNTTYIFNKDTSVKEVTLSNSTKQGNYGIFNIYAKLSINPVGRPVGTIDKCGVLIYLVDSSKNCISNTIPTTFSTAGQTGYSDKTIGTTSTTPTVTEAKSCRLNTETKNAEIYLVIIVTAMEIDDQELTPGIP